MLVVLIVVVVIVIEVKVQIVVAEKERSVGKVAMALEGCSSSGSRGRCSGKKPGQPQMPPGEICC